MDLILSRYLALVLLPTAFCFICDKGNPHCHTSLDIKYAYTMIDPIHGPVYAKNGKLFSNKSDTEIPLDAPITSGDGYHLPIPLVTANGTMPGPTIVLYANQKITIIVTNTLFNEAVTIHWHGIDQRGWPFMDGVSFVTQCPILPGQSFNYTFQPTFSGTYWYHSHVGNQRDFGLYGAFVVLRETESENDVGNVMMVGEWNHNFNPTTIMTAKGIKKQPQSVLINGKGQFDKNEAPLQTFSAKSGENMRFRLIAIGSAKTILFGIESHEMIVKETDGFPVKDKIVDKIIIYPAERYDFIIKAGNSGPYDITAQVLESKYLNISSIMGTGVLNVTEGDSTPSTTFVPNNKTRILNCPFQTFPGQPSFQCITISELKSSDDNSYYKVLSLENDKTVETQPPYFLNFGFVDSGAAINGRMFQWPTVSAISQPSWLQTCDDVNCVSDCHCTHSLSLRKNANVTIVLLNLGTGSFISHPIHIHGHTYKVIKMGFPTVNDQGELIPNNDIKCSSSENNEESLCSKASWRDPVWNEKLPGVNVNNPVRKDTTVVPYGGYVVVQFFASNPGVWFMHCHIDKHMVEGMALMLNESFEDFGQSAYAIPLSFPTCNSYDAKAQSIVSSAQQRENEITTAAVIGIVLGTTCGIVLIIIVIMIMVKYRRRESPPRSDIHLAALPSVT